MPAKNFLNTLLLLFVACCTSAQLPSQLIFSRITKKEGLASNTTFQTLRDKQGFLWIASQNGLQRYDGYRFLSFRHIPGDNKSIPGNTLNHLYIDRKDRLWLIFDRQVGSFDMQHFNYTATKLDSNTFMVKKLLEDPQGNILLFADNKVFLYDEKQNSFTSTLPLPALPPGVSIGDMAIDPASGLTWFTGKQGSRLYDAKAKAFVNPKTSFQDSLFSIKNARYPFIDKDGTWWMVNWIPFVGPAPVLFRYDSKNNSFTRFEKIRPYKADSYYEIWNVFQQANGTIWIYGMGLLAYYNTEEKRFIHINSNPFQQNGIDYVYVSNLYEDKERNVWVSTDKGLYRFNVEAQVFHNIDNRRVNDTSQFHNAISHIVETKNNGIWVSTWGAGVFSYNKNFQPIANPFMATDPMNKILHSSYMIQRSNADIWIGTQFGELKVYNPSTNKATTVVPALLQGKIITQLFEDKSGNVWIGSTSGLLVKCNNGNYTDTANAYVNVLPESADIMKLYEDSRHHLWVCTASDGLYEINIADNKIIKRYTGDTPDNKGLLSNGASDIVQYEENTYLIASEGLCILNYSTGEINYLLTGINIPTEHITNIILDKQKRIWVAADGGFYRLNLDNKLYVSYDAADGITNDVFQVASGTVLSDGKIAIGTPGSFVVFDPEKTVDKNLPPQVNVTSFVLGQSNLSMDSIQKLEHVELAHNNTFLSIGVSTLSFRDQFYIYYMLEGLDKTWKRVYNGEITYQYLPPGTYTLKLKSRNGEGAESSEVTSLKIHVNPPFWQTWWFYSLLALMAGGLFYWIDHIRIKRKTAILKMRNDIADDLHEDINGALSNIAILSEIARMKAEKEPEKSIELIEQIRTRSQNMSLAMEDILWSINPGNDSMKNFMLRYREFIHSLKSQDNVQIDVLIDKNAEDIQLSMKQRSDIFSLFKSGLRNVIKSGARVCHIHITLEKPNLVYTLQFDTDSVDMQLLNNLRQRNELKDKLQELNAKLEFNEHKSNAVFVLSIPVKKDGI